ncbi:MAG TPA: phage holin family protein [Candidatus Baltobacteraceae bacterium]|nr:phage holin family protein [Candidatus Baltobacteraceae bacterium]
MHPILRFLITAAALWAIAVYVPGFHIDSIWSAVIAAIVFGLVNLFIGPILKFISFPLTILTIGLFSIVVNWALFAITVKFSPGFHTTGYPWPAWQATLVGAIIMMLVNTFVSTPLTRDRAGA